MEPAPGSRMLRLGLIGAGIQASRTPAMHEAEAAAHGMECVYTLFDLDREPEGAAALPALLRAAERDGFAGLNITHPCKQAVMAHLTEVSDGARGAGAVNTVVLRDGARIGHNTDGSGFRRSMEEGLPGARLDRVVQLGAGGAGGATAHGLLTMGAGCVRVIDAVPARATALSARLAGAFPGRIAAATDVADALADADGLVHATPTGMRGHPGTALPVDLLRPALWVAEVVYFPVETALLVEARRRGCRTLDGTGMALWQAVEAFRLFTGRAADPARMRATFARTGAAARG